MTPSQLVHVLLLVVVITCPSTQVFEWLKHDKFDDLDDKLVAVHEQNCRSKAKSDMLLPSDTVSQIPKFNELKGRIFYKNRTGLLHLHNMALNRAFFVSYILQKMNETDAFYIQPNVHYLYMSLTADINANPSGINSSAIYFDEDCYYPNWFTELKFNRTVPLFAPKAWRWDDTLDPDNFLREPTRRVAFVNDIGTGNGRNYTSDTFKMNPWYTFWLPDNSPSLDSVNKYTYATGIMYSNATGMFRHKEFELFNFFGPSSPGQDMKDDHLLPVRFTQPYYDCGRSNKWVVSAVSPIVDFMPRYLNWTHMRRPRFVGVVVLDMDFKEIDFNPCGVGLGNPGPSYLAGIAKCRKSTRCKHRSGYGFRRDSYSCSCRAGFYLPLDFNRNFKGKNIEQATHDEYMASYQCSRTQYLRVLPIVDNVLSKASVNTSIPAPLRTHVGTTGDRSRRAVGHTQFEQDSYNKILKILRHIKMVTASNCHILAPSLLHLSGDVAYGVDIQFEYQGRTALRLAHFLNNFYQNVLPSERFGTIIGGGRIHEEHIFGEVLANVMADHKILSAAVYYEPYVFENVDGSRRKFFGPFAYQRNGVSYAIDTAGLARPYVDTHWYRRVRERWSTNTHSLKTYKMRPMIRADENGTSSVKFEYFPMTYQAPDYADGIWIGPTFRCDGRVDAWVMTYLSPFFKRDPFSNKIRFSGVVTIDVPLSLLEINQCPQPFYIANAFKRTARCHSRSTRCRPFVGIPLTLGAYRCDCKPGFEYPFRDLKRWFEGYLLDREYEKKVQGIFSRYGNAIGVQHVCSNYIIRWEGDRQSLRRYYIRAPNLTISLIRFDSLTCRASSAADLVPHVFWVIIAVFAGVMLI